MAGGSGVWTPPVAPNCRAPHAFHGSLRAPLRARETCSTGALDAPPASAPPAVFTSFRLDQVSRARSAGRRGDAPRQAAGPWADLWAAGAASASRLPPAHHRPAWGRCDSGGSGQRCPCPTSRPVALSWPPSPPPYLRQHGCAPPACSWQGTDRTNA